MQTLLLYAVTLTSSAFLTFWLQPLVGKSALPRFGGDTGASIGLLVVGAVLAAYLYAHGLALCVPSRIQWILHPVLGAVALVCAQNTSVSSPQPQAGGELTLWLAQALLFPLLLPTFFLVSNVALLQKWLARTNHPSGADPYFLFSFVNLGAFGAAFAYVFLIEPFYNVREQSLNWTIAFGGVIGCVVLCAALAWVERGTPLLSVPLATVNPALASAIQAGDGAMAARLGQVGAPRPLFRIDALLSAPTLVTRLAWLFLAALPPFLLAALNTYWAIEVSAIPLFAMALTAAQNLSFVVAFCKWPIDWSRQVHGGYSLGYPLIMAGIVAVFFGLNSYPFMRFLVVPAFGGFYTALLAHGFLARLRPATSHLTEYYLWIFVGGVLGGAGGYHVTIHWLEFLAANVP